MSMTRFISLNRKVIDEYIRSVCPNCGKLDYSERVNWILNYESLYGFAVDNRVTYQGERLR